ncbi:hypothetical protein Noda2021_11080 [Candidatus Dependentiae bacterium Noda2021]|nr:hypothetical protein Noda2021_11080 [Candidatus Dependentiae bacterium Noda2021]
MVWHYVLFFLSVFTVHSAEQATVSLPKPSLTPTKLSKKSHDGFVLATDDRSNKVIIHDTRNQAVLTVFKSTNELNRIALPLSYARNVRQWFENPQAAKKDQGYLIPGSRKYILTTRFGNDPVLLHAFSLLVDDYLPYFAAQGTKRSRKYYKQYDTTLTMQGTIIDHNQKKIKGAFTYFFDEKSGICYHRFFQPQFKHR